MEIGWVFTTADFSCHGMTSAWNIKFLSDGNHRKNGTFGERIREDGLSWSVFTLSGNRAPMHLCRATGDVYIRACGTLRLYPPSIFGMKNTSAPGGTDWK